MDALFPILLFIGYIVLMRFVLPKFGIYTWMAQSCSVEDRQKNVSQMSSFAKNSTETIEVQVKHENKNDKK